jgi:hypothetical protein
MKRGLFLGWPVVIIPLYEVVKALESEGLDGIYEKLERLFFTEQFVIVNRDNKVVFAPLDCEEIYDFLEFVYEKLVKDNKDEEV